jgi:hypothetical protein
MKQKRTHPENSVVIQSQIYAFYVDAKGFSDDLRKIN